MGRRSRRRGRRIFKKLLAAQKSKDYDAFVADGTSELKAALTITQFNASSDILNARFKGGYESALPTNSTSAASRFTYTDSASRMVETTFSAR